MWEEPMWEETMWEEPHGEKADGEEPHGEEPMWEEPVFEDVSISSVAWAGSKHWDRALYTLTNGKTVFASKGLDVGDIPFNYEEIRTSGGGYYSAPAGVAGHTHVNDGGALIIKQGESFLLQVYAWGNQGPVMSPTTSDVTKEIGSIEEREDSDINGDGFIGAPEEDEIEVEVSSVIYDNPDSWFDRSLYEMTDGKVIFAEQGLAAGDLAYEGQELNDKNGSPIETDGVVGMIHVDDKFGVVYNNDGVVTQQLFKWGNRGPRISGKLRDVTKQVDTIEERENIDLNGDGFIGASEEDEIEVEVSSVIYDNPDSWFDRSIYEMTDGTVIFAEQGLSAGDMSYEGEELKDKNGSPIETKGVVGIIGVDDKFGIIYNNDGVVAQQLFKWGNRGPKISGKLRDVTKQADSIEDREGIDVNGDGLIGGQSAEDAEVQTVIVASPRDSFDRSLYKLTDGITILGETGLEPGDLPFDNDPLLNGDGSPYSADNAVGLIGMRDGLAVVLRNGEDYVMQQFSWKGRSPKVKGKERNITKRVFDLEDKEGIDLTGDGIIGEPYSGQDPEVSRVIFPGNDEFDEGLYQMNNGDLVFAESELEPGDTSFEDEIITNKKGQPYQGVNIVGIYPIKKGFALIEDNGGTYQEQGFRFKGGKPKPYGKSRKVKNIDKIELKSNFDINNDGLIGGKRDEDNFAMFRLIQPFDENTFVDPLA